MCIIAIGRMYFCKCSCMHICVYLFEEKEKQRARDVSVKINFGVFCLWQYDLATFLLAQNVAVCIFAFSLSLPIFFYALRVYDKFTFYRIHGSNKRVGLNKDIEDQMSFRDSCIIFLYKNMNLKKKIVEYKKQKI